MRRLFRGPLSWILLIVLAVIVITNVLSGMGGPTAVETHEAYSTISQLSRNTQAHVLIVDGDQSLVVTKDDGSKVTSQFNEGQQSAIIELARKAGVPWNSTKPRSNIWVSILVSLIPIALMLLLLFFFLNQMQGGGSRIFQWGWNPVGGASFFDSVLTPNNLVLALELGTVTVTTT